MARQQLTLLAAATLVAGLAGTADAASITYNFDSGTTPVPTTYVSGTNPSANGWSASGSTITAPVSSNDFGAGVTASAFSFTDDGGSSNRLIAWVTEASVSDGTEARAMLQSNDQTHVFTITIDDTVLVDLTNLSWDSGTVFAEHSWTLDISAASGASFSTSGNPLTTTASGTRRGVNNSENLTGLTGLTNTTVTVTITDTTARNNNNVTFYSFLDNVNLTGSVSPVPEPGSLALTALGGMLVLRRRRD